MDSSSFSSSSSSPSPTGTQINIGSDPADLISLEQLEREYIARATDPDASVRVYTDKDLGSSGKMLKTFARLYRTSDVALPGDVWGKPTQAHLDGGADGKLVFTPIQN